MSEIQQILAAIAALIAAGVGLWLRGWSSRGRADRQRRADQKVKNLNKRQEIEDEIQQDTNLADRARDAGIVRRE